MNAIQQSGGSRSEARLLSAILVIAICLTLAPILRLFVEGITDQGSPSLALMRDVLAQPSTLSALRHSLITAGFGTLVSVVLGAAFAFMVALTDLRAKAALVFCLMIPMMIPPQITALSWTQIMGPSSVLLKTLGVAPPAWRAPAPVFTGRNHLSAGYTAYVDHFSNPARGATLYPSGRGGSRTHQRCKRAAHMVASRNAANITQFGSRHGDYLCYRTW